MKFLQDLFAFCEHGYCTITKLGRTREESTELVHVNIDNLASVDEIIRTYPGFPLYFNVGLKNEKPVQGSRGDKSTVSQLTCLWADIDFPKAGSRKLYPPPEHVYAALAAMPVRHSALVETGGGVHVYWFLSEPVALDGSLAAAESFEARYSKRWEALLLSQLRKIDRRYEIDTVADVTRMLRLPGSTHQNGKIITVAEYNGTRYHLDDLASYCDGVSCEVEAYHPEYVASLPADLDGTLDEKKLDALLKNCTDFRRVWERRKLFPSPSEHDASIASFAAAALWPDKDIANLVVRFNKINNPERLAKVTRVSRGEYDYIVRLLRLVRHDQSRYEAASQLAGEMAADDGDFLQSHRQRDVSDGYDSCGDQCQTGDHSGDSPSDPGDAIPPEQRDKKPELSREEITERLSVLLNIPVERWIQVGRECPIYTLVLKGGQQIKIGGESGVLFGQRAFATRVYSETKVVMPTHTNREWSSICIGLGKIVEIIDAPEVTSSDVAVGVVRTFLEKQRWREGADFDRGLAQGLPVRRSGKFYVQVPALSQYAAKFLSMKWSAAEFVSAFRNAGFERETIHYTATNGKRTTKSVWSCDEGLFFDLIPTQDDNSEKCSSL